MRKAAIAVIALAFCVCVIYYLAPFGQVGRCLDGPRHSSCTSRSMTLAESYPSSLPSLVAVGGALIALGLWLVAGRTASKEPNGVRRS